MNLNLQHMGRPVYEFHARPLQRRLGNLQILLSYPSLTLEVFLHSKLGKRYATWGKLILTTLLLTGVYWTVRLLSGTESPLFLLYLKCFIGFALMRRIQTEWRRFKKIPAHAFDRGTPWRLWGWLKIRHAYFIYGWCEPLLCLIIGLCVPETWLKTWLIAASLSLFLKAQIDALMLRWLKGDITDGVIEAGQINHSTLRNQSDQQTDQVAVIQASNTHYPTAESAYANLDPALKELIQAGKQTEEE